MRLVIAFFLLAAAVPFAGAQSAGPPCPTGIAGYVTEDGDVFLSWTLMSSTDVVVYRAEGDGDFEAIQRLEFPSTRTIDHDVQPGVTYRYQVKAIAPDGRESDACGTFEVSTVPDLAGLGIGIAAGLGVLGYAVSRKRK